MIDLHASQIFPKIFTVTEMTRSIKGLLETEFPFVTITGEISNLRRPHSGHSYFTLKDEGAQISAVLFKQQLRYLASPPKDGEQVICRGRIAVYEPRGSYQLIVDFMEAKGVGLLQLEFEECKRRLGAEGLFNEGLKKKIPMLPERVALITSPTGAAVHDFLAVAESRFPNFPIEIIPVSVQGENAAPEICKAIAHVNTREDISVIVLCRGGGSLEDLWPFNDEELARAIHASTIPVVSAVGHEIDFTIADFVADLRAPTPSAAAEMIIPDRSQLQEKIMHLTDRLGRMMAGRIEILLRRIHTQQRILGDPRTLLTNSLLRLDHAQSALIHGIRRKTEGRHSHLEVISGRFHKQSPAHKLATTNQQITDLSHRLHMAGTLLLSQKNNNLKQAKALLEAVGPKRVLGRGYAIVRDRDSKSVLRDADQTAPGKNVEVQLSSGQLECEVTAVRDQVGTEKKPER